MYKGIYKNNRMSDNFPSMAPRLSDDCNSLIIKLCTSVGSLSIRINYDDKLKKLFYECACFYLDYHMKNNNSLGNEVPDIYKDILEEDYKIFAQ